MATALTEDRAGDHPHGAPTSKWISDVGRFDSRAHEQLVALLGDFFKSGDRLSPRMMHLIWVAVDLVVTHIYPDGVGNHVRGAMEHGATAEEVVEVFEIVSTIADRSIDIAFPIIIEEARSAGIAFPDLDRDLSAEDAALKARLAEKLGFIPPWIDLALRVAPEFVRAHLAMGHAPDKAGALSPKDRALIYVSIYSSPALIESDALRLHVQQAIRLGAVTQELLDVVQLASGISLHAFMSGVPFLIDQEKR
jgi:alkylhydroperoxidase/carboxymuconolactone decarboxylase family protein YurZ